MSGGRLEVDAGIPAAGAATRAPARPGLLAALPYAAGLVLAGLGFALADAIPYGARPGQLGPGFWPKAALALMGAVCLVEVVKALLGRRGGEARGIAEAIEVGEDEDEAPRRPGLLLAGLALTVGYGALLPLLGFPLASAVFLVAFMYLGGARAHGVVWGTSLVAALAFSVLFLRVVYVSLPRGLPPFDRITDLIVSFP